MRKPFSGLSNTFSAKCNTKMQHDNTKGARPDAFLFIGFIFISLFAPILGISLRILSTSVPHAHALPETSNRKNPTRRRSSE